MTPQKKPRPGKENLKVPTSEQARINGRKGGLASQASQKRKKALKECLELLLEGDVKAADGKVVSGAEAISVELFNKALKGDIRAFEVVRDTAGQKPADKVVVSEVDSAVIKDVEDIVAKKLNEE